MPNFTNASIRPHLARVLLQAENHAMVPAQVRAQLENELTFSPDDLVIDQSGQPRWWHCALSTVNRNGLRQLGMIHPTGEVDGHLWRLTDPNGVAWAQEVQAMLEWSDAPPKLAYQPDARVRKAVELRALEVAEAQYNSENYKTKRVGSPYDLDCVRATPQDSRHVEVKGFQDDNPSTIILTAGEVRHAYEGAVPVDLVIVAGISLEEVNGKVSASGGRIFRHVRNWQPLNAHLTPTHFSYVFP